mgnify:CR=1 FL=1
MKTASPRLSRPSKMPCKTWSLPAWDTCPGSREKGTANAVPACQLCYARGGRYVMKNVRAPRDHNLIDWQANGWVSAMVALIGRDKYFRWFDSGDVYSAQLAGKILRVIQATPNCEHWVPTRSHKEEDIRPILERMALEPNAVVRWSSDSITGETLDTEHSSTIIRTAEDFTPEVGSVLCRASERKGKCKSCRACWKKEIRVIFYPAHGQKVKKAYA